jgi:hypothetical protein
MLSRSKDVPQAGGKRLERGENLYGIGRMTLKNNYLNSRLLSSITVRIKLMLRWKSRSGSRSLMP